MNITFTEKKETNFQVSIIKMLESYQFKFVPINEYNNDHFYCRIIAPKTATMDKFSVKFAKWLGMSNLDERVVEFTLAMTIYNNFDVVDRIPMVFTQQDVINIINDLPDNYVGENIL